MNPYPGEYEDMALDAKATDTLAAQLYHICSLMETAQQLTQCSTTTKEDLDRASRQITHHARMLLEHARAPLTGRWFDQLARHTKEEDARFEQNMHRLYNAGDAAGLANYAKKSMWGDARTWTENRGLTPLCCAEDV